MTRNRPVTVLAVIGTAAAVASVVVGVKLSTSSGASSSDQDALTVRALSAPPVLANSAATVEYAAEGLTSAAPPTGVASAATVYTAADAVARFPQQKPVTTNFTSLDGSPADVSLREVTDGLPTDPAATGPQQHLAWVVTFHHSTPNIRGGHHPNLVVDPSAFNCDFIGMMDANSGDWFKLFQDCH